MTAPEDWSAYLISARVNLANAEQVAHEYRYEEAIALAVTAQQQIARMMLALRRNKTRAELGSQG